MASSVESTNIGKQVIISLGDLSHEVCVAATQVEYWQQLKKGSNISITSNGKYVPKEFKSICNEDDEPRLQLIIQSQYEKDNKQIDKISTRIRHDLVLFKRYNESVFDISNHQLFVFASLFNSLSTDVFSFELVLLGEQNCNIKQIEKTFNCSIVTDKLTPQRYRFTIRHKELVIMDLAAIHIQALVKQVQYQYIIAFAGTIKQSIERLETSSSSSSLSLNSYKFSNKIDEDQQLTTTIFFNVEAPLLALGEQIRPEPGFYYKESNITANPPDQRGPCFGLQLLDNYDYLPS
ncbi:unnamed protein product [Adineta steineri]|uniref:Uncharacterized protein n=1 Tax=Adineta steineri TaxID=433720 RepID=A0A819QAF8_9BILA|nr:unnamed protein product [Adineta steineri]CAF4026191.1 unnamed protein product [Adineta steineri]